MVAATWRESFNAITEAATVSSGNSAFSSTGGTGTLQALVAAKIRGTRGCRLSATGASRFATYTFPASHATASAEMYFHYTTGMAVSVELSMLQLRNPSGGRLSAGLGTSGILRVINAVGSTIRNLNSNTALTNGHDYRLQITGAQNASPTTTNGRCLVWLDDLTSSTNIETYDSGATVNVGTDGEFTECRWGKTGATGDATYDWDEAGILFDSTSQIDLISANVAPTANAGPDQTGIEPYTTVTLDFSGSSDPESSPLTYTCTQATGTTVTLSGSGNSRTFEAPGTIAGETLTFNLTVNDGTADSTADTVAVTVLPVTRRAAIGGVWVPSRRYLLTS